MIRITIKTTDGKHTWSHRTRQETPDNALDFVVTKFFGAGAYVYDFPYVENDWKYLESLVTRPVALMRDSPKHDWPYDPQIIHESVVVTCRRD